MAGAADTTAAPARAPLGQVLRLDEVVRRLLPSPAADELGDTELIDELAYDDAVLPFVRANMIASVDGAAAGGDGRSGSLGGPADRRVFHVLRGLADVVVAGAGTVRAEAYGPAELEPATRQRRRRLGQRPAAIVAVASARLDVDLDGPLLSGPRDAGLVLTATAAPADRRRAVAERMDVLVVGEEHVDPVRAVAALAERGLGRIHCEGGPTLLAAWAAAGVVDELCLTISPQLIGGGAPRVLRGTALRPAQGLALTGLLEEEGALFARWRRA